MRPVLLDLFCGGGGAAKGYSLAGWDVIGIDINRQPNYPFTFIRDDAIEVLRNYRRWAFGPVAAIHASPPCQRYTRKSANWGRKRTHFLEHPDLLPTVRELLDEIGLPYVIENVVGAPIRGELMLCGTMFGLKIKKHRLFEANWPLPFPPAECDHRDTYNPWSGKGRSAELLREAMGVDWLPISGGASRRAGYTGDLFNAIPPAYTEYIGKYLIEVVENSAITKA